MDWMTSPMHGGKLAHHELGLTSGDGEGQGGLACCSPWGRKEMTRLGD